MAIYIAALLPVLIGFALVAIDGSRLFNLHTHLQEGADALALTGAAELDRKADSITRSTNAINNLVDNEYNATQPGGLAAIAVAQIRFLSALPANDVTAIDASFVTADPTAARFVEVTVAPVALNTILPASFLGGANAVTTQARAVAGFDSAVCRFTPLYICNPFENTGITLRQAINTPSIRRRLIELRQQGGEGAQYFPGNYGFLQPDDNPGANALRDMLAIDRPPACFFKNGVELRTGFVATVRDALNTRFDMYEGPMSSVKGNSSYRPARNVRKGYSTPPGNACNQSPELPENGYEGLPRDNCFAGGTCPHMGGRMGDGNWAFDAYWNINFAGIAKPLDPDGNPYSDANPPSRHFIYRYEVDNGLVSNPSAGGETGNPQCYTGGTLNDNPDRRLLFGAVLNCVALDEEYDISGGSAPPLPVEAFAKFFITEPIVAGPEQSIFVEVVEFIEPGNTSSTVVRDVVQLYR